MKRLQQKHLQRVLGLGAIVTVLATPVLFSKPVLAQLQQIGQTVAQTLQREPQIQLTLSAAKQVTTIDSSGKSETVWQPLVGEVTVQPGDLLQYQLDGKNVSDRPARNLVVTQPIPNGMKYVLNSATQAEAAGSPVTFSIDRGRTFVANPTIQVTLPDGTIETRPAPAEAYTHLRWNFGDALGAGTVLKVAYQVEVR